MKYLLIILLACSMCFASDWYVSMAGAGSKNGTSAANAWDTFANITWGAGGVVAGDTLYVIGTVTNQMTVGASGSAGSPITIRGDAAGETTGIITSETSTNVIGADWIVVPDKSTYEFQTVNLEPTMFFKGDTRLIFVAFDTNAADTADAMEAHTGDTFSVEVATNKAYVHLEDDSDPDDLGGIANFSVSRNFQRGITMLNKSYIIVKNLTFKKNTQNAVHIANSGSNLITNVIVENCTVTATGRFGIFFQGASGNTTKMTGMVVRNCTTTDCGLAGIKGSNAIDGLLVENNTLSVCGWQSDTNQISIGAVGAPTTKPVNCIIRGNISFGAISFEYSQAILGGGAADDTENEGYGIMLEVNSADFIVENNICYDNQGTGIRINEGDGHTIRHNICYGNGKLAKDSGFAGGIDVFKNDGNMTFLLNNTLYDNQAGISIRNDEGTGAVTIKNNIVSSSLTFDMRRVATTANFTIDNNCYFNAGVANNFRDSGVTTDFAAWQVSMVADASSIESDPKFINPTTDFHLGSNSPCLGIGRFNEEYPLGRNRYNKFGARRLP